MKAFIRGIYAEILKMRHTFLFPFYLGIPILGCAVFLLYFQFSGGNGRGQISGYMEVIGAALPFAVSIVCSGNIRLEEQNHFQVLLGGPAARWKGLAVKFLALAGLGFLATAGAAVLFGAGYRLLPAGAGQYLSAGAYLKLGAVLFLGSVPLYLEHLFLNLAFSGTVSQCTGVAQSLLAALFLTGLGDGRWQFFPCAWSARGTVLALNGVYQEPLGNIYDSEVRKTALICLLLLVLICAIIGLWYHYYEGRQCND